MSLPDFKTQIKSIRKEALDIGFSIKTMDGYLSIWNKFIEWKNEDYFIYSKEEYSRFLLEYYNFDVSTYSSKSKSRHQQYMRSKRILDDFDNYKSRMDKTMFSKSYACDYPVSWNITIDNYTKFLENVKQNSKKTIELRKRYLIRELSYFYRKGLINLSDFSPKYINEYLNDVINAGNVSKRRNFASLREFLKYLFIEGIINENLYVYVPTITKKSKVKLPTYIKQEKIEELLDTISKDTSVEIRDYVIILLAARLGLRISDILNIKLKDIDWKNNKFKVIQPKTNNLNILPLSKEVGWAIIDYIKVRPKCSNEYLFVKFKYPFEKINKFDRFNKYFDKIDIETNDNNKKGIHNLRSSLAKNMLDNDIPLDIIASTLGDSREVTSNTYIKIDIKNLKKTTLEVNK